MMKKFIVVILLAAATNAFSQDWPVKKMVTEKKTSGKAFVSIPAFSFSQNKLLPGRGEYQELNLNNDFNKQLFEQRPEAIQVSIPLNATENINCELVRFDLGNIKFTQNDNTAIQNVKIPVTYRGIVSGEINKNNVMLTVNEDYLSLTATLSDRAIQITKPDRLGPVYRLYDSKKIQFPVVPFECGTKEEASFQPPASPIQSPGIGYGVLAPQNKCVNVFVDCFDSLYQWRNRSMQQTIDYVYELFNAVATGYANELINIQITTINVWTTADPYRGDNRANALADLAANYKDNFWGNICVGLDYGINSGGRSGQAGEIGKVKAVSPNTCPAYAAGSNQFCYCDLNYSVFVQNFPVNPNATGPQIYLVMHEIGHLLGAHHTKWCGWKLTSNPDTYGTLDSCGVIEGGCAQGPPPPATGATMMSYCVTGNGPGQFVNFNNGFGTLPGNAIRTFVDQTVCIPDCMQCLGVITAGNNNGYAFNQQLSESGIDNKDMPVLDFTPVYPYRKEIYRRRNVQGPASP